MRIVLLLSLILATASACEPDRSIGSDITSGSRLRARYWVAPGGAEIFADWYDSELGVPCEPRQSADGSLRCLPTMPVGAMAGTTGPGTQITVFYADSACTQRVQARSSQCGAIPALIRRHESNTCGGHFVVHEVAGEATIPELFGEDPQSGECRSLGAPHASVEYVHLGEELAPSALVALTEQDAGGSGRLRRRLYRGSDGSRLPRDLYDVDLDIGCTPGIDADGQLRCLPEAIDAYSYADAQCQTPLAQWGQSDPECAVPDYVYGRKGEFVACTIRSHIYSLGEPTADVTPYMQYDEDTCEPNGLPPGAVGTLYGWTLGDEISPETFVALEAPPPQGEGRLQHMDHQGPDGFVYQVALWDSQRQETCRPALMADGLTRCAPSYRGLVRDTFADDQCTDPALSVWYQFPECADNSTTSYAVYIDDTCPKGRRYFTASTLIYMSTLYEKNSLGECQESLLAPHYVLGDEIPATEFVELSLEQH